MSAHTPGPWAVNAGEPTLVYDPRNPEDESAIAVTYDVESGDRFSWPRDADEAEANARLIAAAPELLRLFRALDEKLPCDWALPSGACDVLAELRAAADAAEGRPASAWGVEDEGFDDVTEACTSVSESRCPLCFVPLNGEQYFHLKCALAEKRFDDAQEVDY